jgi:hypothetical protein
MQAGCSCFIIALAHIFFSFLPEGIFFNLTSSNGLVCSVQIDEGYISENVMARDTHYLVFQIYKKTKSFLNLTKKHIF